MKQILHFLNEQDFQNFTSQLFGEELPDYQPIEGAGGDKGLDGIEGKTAYQMFFPEPKNRTKRHYTSKIDDSLAKLRNTIEAEDLDIERWIFVVPEDLRADVILYLQKKAQEIGVKGLYYGATKLTALVNKYPYIRNAFPGIFLPDLKEDIERVNDGVNELSQRTVNSSDILKENDYYAERARLREVIRTKMHSVNVQYGHTSVPMAAGPAIQREYQPKLDELERRFKESQELYKLEEREINKKYDELVRKKEGEHAGRGTFDSGFRANDVAEIEEARQIALDKLAIKYGKPTSGKIS